MKELIISTVLQNGIVGQSHLLKNQKGFDWISERTKLLYWPWSPWQPWGTSAQACAEQATPGSQERNGQTYSSHLWGAQSGLCRQDTVTISHSNISLLLALLSLVFPYPLSCQGSPRAWEFSVLFVCLQMPYCCQHHRKVLGHFLVPSLGRAMQLLSPRQRGLAAGWRWPQTCTPVLHFHIKQRIETTTSGAWQEKKRAECGNLPSLDSI